jgi:hypothetical protein
MERNFDEQDDMTHKPPAPEGYQVPPEPDERPQPNEQPEDAEIR